MCKGLQWGLAAVVSCAVSAFPTAGVGQQRDNKPIKSVALQQNASRQTTQNLRNTRQQLQARAEKILADETAREAAGVCKDAHTTVDFDECFGNQAGITGGNLKKLEDVIAELGDPDPASPDRSADKGRMRSVLSPNQHVAEFRKVEQNWRQYRDAACTAALHQFDGGTGGPSFELQCEMRLDQSHMRELEMIYGGDLRL